MITSNPFLLLIHTLASIRRHKKLFIARLQCLDAVARAVEGVVACEVGMTDNDLGCWTSEGAIDEWYADLDMFCDEATKAFGYKHQFFRRVAIPAALAYNILRNGGDDLLAAARLAQTHVTPMKDGAWKTAMTAYLNLIVKSLEKPKNDNAPPAALA